MEEFDQRAAEISLDHPDVNKSDRDNEDLQPGAEVFCIDSKHVGKPKRKFVTFIPPNASEEELDKYVRQIREAAEQGKRGKIPEDQ